MDRTDQTMDDVKPLEHCFVEDNEAKMTSIPELVDLPRKTGEIFRNNDGQYSFMCFNCGLIFEDFGEIISHCETHYQDVKYNVSEFVLCPETGTEGMSSLSTETSEPKVVSTTESTNLPMTTHQASVRRKKRKRKMNECVIDFPQHCPICGVWCDDNFRDHMKKTHDFQHSIYQCFMCRLCFKSGVTLKKHMKTAHKNTCYHCAMEPPINSPTEPRRHKCLFCKEWFGNHAEFRIHFKKAHDKDADTFFAKRANCNIFTCYVCEKEVPKRGYLVEHMLIHYDKFLRHTCPSCGLRFRRYGQLTQHLKKHEGKMYQCDQCSKEFPYPAKLRAHRLSHVTELNFKCDQCPKAFNQRKYLNVHRAVHSQQKKYACKFCSATFNFTSGRRAHEKSRHNAL